MNHALDSSAMIAYLRLEPGATTVAQMLKDRGTCYAHTMNLLEVYYGFVRRDGERRALQAMSDLATAGVIEKRTMNRAFVYRVGKLKARGGIALPDCFCIALAQDIGGEVVTTDHNEFDPLVPLNIVPITFIR